jgi:hypothetical protein
MIKKIGLLMFFVFSLVSFNAVANIETGEIENVEENYESREGEQQYQDIEAVFSDFANRMVLGVFGQTALLHFIDDKLTESQKSEIEAFTETEMMQYSKPFNYVISSMVFIVLKASLLIILIILVLYFAWMVIETLFRTQDAGEFLGSSWNKLFSPLKMGFAVMMITPMFGEEFSSRASSAVGLDSGLFTENDFSLAQVFMLKVLGESNNYANKIWTGFVDAQEQYYPAISMPKVTAKKEDFKNFIDHVICLSSTEENNTTETIQFVKAYENSNKFGPYFLAKSENKRCSLTFKMPFDLKTYDYIQTDNFLDSLDVTIDYEKVQTDMTESVLADITPKVKIVADNIVSMLKNKNDNLQSVNDLSTNKIYEVNEKNWRLYCDDFFSGGAKPAFLSEENISKYKYYAANCLSKDFVMKMSKMSNASNLEYPYSDSNYLKKNKVELCVNQNVEPNKPTIASVDDGMPNNIQSCINYACSSGSPYECSSTINFARSLMEREAISEKGWILSGAYTYKFFSSFQNSIGMSLIEDISIDFENIEKPDPILQRVQAPNVQHIQIGEILETSYLEENGAETAFSFDLNINNNGLLFEEYVNYYDSYNLIEPEIKEQNSVENFLVGDDGLLGIKEFLTCVKNPISITDGYQCNNVTEETQDFGIKLIVTTLQLKVVKGVLSGIKNGVKDYKKNKKTEDTGTVKKDFLPAMSNMQLLGVGIASSSVLTFLTDIALQNLSLSGSFSQVEYDLLLNRDAVTLGAFVGIEILLFSSHGFTNFILDALLLLGILLGLILPFMPYFIFLVAFSGFMILFFESMITVLVWAVLIISPSRDHSSDYAKKGFVMILTVFLRAPLIVFGLVAAWLLNNILIGEILSAINIEAAFMQEGDLSIKSLIDLIVVFGVQVLMLYLLYSIIFSIIEGFYDISQKWLFGNTSASPFGDKNRTGEIGAIKDNAKQFSPGRKRTARNISTFKKRF